jgi:hypothetical protein
MQDQVSCALMFAIFWNPSISMISISNNFLKGAWRITTGRLFATFPRKFTHINFLGSLTHVDTTEAITRALHLQRGLCDLNVSNCAFSLTCCGAMARYIIFHGQHLREVNLSSCRIGHQGTRSIIQALNRNVSIRFFNFSNNDMGSSIYEYSIIFGSIIVRHPNLMHADVSGCGLKREEVVFLGLALTMSKTMLGLHISGNDLPYYDRIFLRALMAARVEWKFKNEGMARGIKSNKEYMQLATLAGGQPYCGEVQAYIDHYNNFEQEKAELEFDIEAVLAEMNAEEYFARFQEHGFALADIPEDTKLGQLLGKMRDRHAILLRQQGAVRAALEYKAPPEDGAEDKDVLRAMKEDAQEKADAATGTAFEQAQQMKVDRDRLKAEKQLQKAKKDRSGGEMAMAFMGVNAVASQLMAENPMNGYMSSQIYTRVLGNNCLEQAEFWTDTTQCWICNKWDIMAIEYDPGTDP